MVSRRDLLTRLGCLGLGGATLGSPLGRTAGAAARWLAPAPGVPYWAADPERRQRGYSSVGLDRLAGNDYPVRASDLVTLDAGFPWRRLGGELRATYPDLPRHFVFEYYPWYGSAPWRHWEQWHRVPPVDVASNTMPLLGAYDSRDAAVIEQHARWIREAGVGAINLSWWGRGSYEDRATHLIMDVMHAHDIKVAFHIEPYSNARSQHYASDLLYLLEEYGEKRSWDAFLILTDGLGRQGPVFKSFRTILPEEITDCHGVTRPVPDYTADDIWARQTDSAREILLGEFDHVLMLADSLNMKRTRRSGFDGVAVYDNYVGAETFHGHAERAAQENLVVSFNCNPGFDGIERRRVPEDSCYEPPEFYPPSEDLDFDLAADRERARRIAQRQIRRSLKSTVAAQTQEAFTNPGRGFFLVYVNSFNEWHEGHSFEPADPWRDLTPAERAFGYHNARQGRARLNTLTRLLRKLLEP